MPRTDRRLVLSVHYHCGFRLNVCQLALPPQMIYPPIRLAIECAMLQS
jgi:hypothetical protein